MDIFRSLIPGRYEHVGQPILPPVAFALRVGRNLILAIVIVTISLGGGIIGYHGLAGFGWVDSFLNAAMILSGMGPTKDLTNDAAKIFAGLYALYAGFLVIAVFGLVLAPLLHRLLHRLHADDDEKGEKA